MPLGFRMDADHELLISNKRSAVSDILTLCESRQWQQCFADSPLLLLRVYTTVATDNMPLAQASSPLAAARSSWHTFIAQSSDTSALSYDYCTSAGVAGSFAAPTTRAAFCTASASSCNPQPASVGTMSSCHHWTRV